MNCTVCGKPHSKEEPITILNEYQRLCPGCLKVLSTEDQHFDFGDPIHGGTKADWTFFIDDMPKHSNCKCSAEPVYVKRSLTCYTASIKIGDMELPVESFEIR